MVSCNKDDTDFGVEEEEIVDVMDNGKKSKDKKRIRIVIDKKEIILYCYKQDQLKYIELLINSKFEFLNKSFLDDVLDKYKLNECNFTTMHGFVRIEDIYNLRNNSHDTSFGFEFDDMIE